MASLACPVCDLFLSVEAPALRSAGGEAGSQAVAGETGRVYASGSDSLTISIGTSPDSRSEATRRCRASDQTYSGQSADGDGTRRRNRQNRVHEQILRSVAAHVGEVMEHKLHEPLGL